MTSNNTLKLSDIVGRGYADFWHFKGRYRVVKGSRASKKSKTCALWFIINLMIYPLANILVVRRYERTLRDSCFADLKWAISKLGLEQEFKCTVSPFEITRLSTNQKILFRGFDQPEKIKSITVPHGILCWVFFEEASEIETFEKFHTLDLSIRGEAPKGYFKQLTLIFNPISDKHWLKKQFFDTPNDENKLALTTTYKNNEWLDAADLRVFEQMRITNPRQYRIDGEGEWGVSEGIILPNHEVREFDWHTALQLPGARAFWGLDFGFTDPTAIIGGVLCPVDKAIFIFAEWYRRGATNENIAKAIKGLGLKCEKVVCDSAEPKSIEELKRLGINATGADKSPDSVRYGIQLLQGFKFIIHPSCTNFIYEISNYSWAKDRSGEFTDKPDHEFSHGNDACRYAVTYYIPKQGLKFNSANLTS